MMAKTTHVRKLSCYLPAGYDPSQYPVSLVDICVVLHTRVCLQMALLLLVDSEASSCSQA